MKNTILFVAIGMILFSCNKLEEKKKEVSTSLIENAFKSAAGNEFDALDVNSIDKNTAVVEVKVGDENLSKRFEKGFGNITASKETIAITISAGEQSHDNILIGFTGKDLTQNHPIKAKMNNSEGVSMSFSMMNIENNNMIALISQEAKAEILQLTEAKTVIHVKGKISYPADVESPEKWKDYEGTITLNYPVFQALGSSKEDFIY